MMIDPFNFCVVRVQPMFNDLIISEATGFFYSGIFNNKPNLWLITNWHVLTGRNAENPNKILHTEKALPNRIRIQVLLLNGINEILMHEQFITYYGKNKEALWYQHQDKNLVDIAVLNMGTEFTMLHPLIKGINGLANQDDMAVNIGNDVYILGYPLAFRHFADTPIWKKGSIASEPHLETPDSKHKIVIDATTRSGMSGSPVIMRASTHYLSESGEVKSHPGAARFIGVYASRPPPSLPRGISPQVANYLNTADGRHELGYVYKSGLVGQIILSGIRGPDFGELP